ncbi:DUF4097 family beta strand repeat-containing protein [Algoriphagus namhaensis]|uniref:DUF4097 family beta strand repeat-containing protein n=1 Tax=Algoriphagus namhaensis TaxID=915353 RepID=A0ABV8AQU6_9BACT
MKTYLKPILATAIFILLASASFAQNVLVDVTKNYSNISVIEVEGGWLAVKYEGGSGPDVSVDAFLKSNDDDQDIVFVTVGDVLKIKFERKRNNYSWNNSNEGYIHITGPSDMKVDIKNSSGSIYVAKLRSEETNISVSSGKVKAQDIDGNLMIKATSGNLQVDGVSGDVIAGLTSGNADLVDIKGNADFKATSGSLDAKNIGGKLNVQFTSGNAKLENIGELGRLKFTSGNIRAENAGLGSETSFSGTSGSFRVQTPSNLKNFNYDLKASSGSVKVGSTSGGKTLKIDNNAESWIEGSISSGRISIEN